MNKSFLIIFLLLPAASFSIVPPQNSHISIPQDMLDNLSVDPYYYMPRHGFLKTMQRFREQKVSNNFLRKENHIFVIKPNLPVFCAQYADIPQEEWPVSQLQEMLFGTWATGSMQDYYKEVSYDQLSPEGNVYEWLQVSGDSKYYERANQHTGDLLTEIFTAFDDSVDFGLYDNDGADGIPNSGDDDGFVDVVIIVHSGPGAEEIGGPEIWSHFSVYSKHNNTSFVTNDLRNNGGKIQIDDYMIAPAIQKEKMVNIGVFCHEFGHALGLPDLYDRDYSSSGVGYWCVMSSGMWGGDGKSPETPSHFSPWCKEVLGWINPVVIKQNTDHQAIQSVETFPVVYKLWKKGQIEPYNYRNHFGVSVPLGKEYFLIENRQKTGFDKALLNSGLLIWHVDNTVSDSKNNDNEQHKIVDLEEADGLNQLDHAGNKGDAGDPFPGTSNKRIFDKHSIPNSLAYDGFGSKVAVTDISSSANIMTANLQVLADDIEVVSYSIDDNYGNKNGYLDPGETVNLYVSIINNGDFLNRVDASLSTKDPAIVINDNSAVYRNLNEDEVKINSDDPFNITALDDISKHPVLCTLTLKSLKGYTTQLDLIVSMENNRILLVDDSRAETDATGQSILRYYQDALDKIDYLDYDVWLVHEQKNPTRMLMKEYGLVIWFTGSQDFSFSLNEMANFRNLMYTGRKLFFSGQNIGRHMMTYGTDVERSFFEDWMHSRYIADNVNGNSLLKITGIAGDPISDSFRPYFYASGGDGALNQTSPSVIAPDDEATPVFEYAGTGSPGQYAAIKYDGNYKLVYFAFSFEAINDKDSGDEVRRNVMQKVVDWFQGSVVTESEGNQTGPEKIPQHAVVLQNYPNPFNSKTTIIFELSKTAHVLLKVYNTIGREIAILAKGEKQAGMYRINWDGSDELGRSVTSGVYFYRLLINEYSLTKKMILLR